MDTPPNRAALVWLRDDLRLADNPALAAAAESGRELVILYVLDEESDGIRPLGGASKWWLHHSLSALDTALRKHGQRLTLRRGRADAIITDLVAKAGIGSVFWNRRYGGPERDLDARIKASLKSRGVAVESFHASLLFEPWTVQTATGQPFRVFTPFWRACQAALPPRLPLPAPSKIPPAPNGIASDALDEWRLLPTRPNWAAGFAPVWQPGEAGAAARLDEFVGHRIRRYRDHRDEPAAEASSRLSPHLRFGEISPFQIWHAVETAEASGAPLGNGNVEKFRAELGWREFCWHLLYANPDLATKNFQPRFDEFPWSPSDEAAVTAWQEGRTGYPLVDAGMRELWRTGWMHNRVRMITASFLIKNLLTDWRIGEAWFWDTLVDADAGSNPANWQWVAGSGADAAPYFRVFNPVLQGEKFDPKGDYVRGHVPELAKLSGSSVHTPWKISGGNHYPPPIVDLGTSRARALDAFQKLRGGD